MEACHRWKQDDSLIEIVVAAWSKENRLLAAEA